MPIVVLGKSAFSAHGRGLTAPLWIDHAPIPYLAAQDFVAALAQPFDSSLGRKVVVPFGITWSNAVKLGRDLGIYDISAVEAFGLGLSYKDIGLVVEREHNPVGSGPFVMTSCVFWGGAQIIPARS